jgi:uncharacterized protein YbaP (TraB family)
VTKITEHNIRYYSMLGTLVAGFASVCMMLGRRDESFSRAQNDIVELRQITAELAKTAASTAQTTVHHGEKIAELRQRIERMEDRQ